MVVTDPGPQPVPGAAWTVNVVEPGGVAPVVLIVKVEPWLVLLPVLTTGLGLNEAVAPVGNVVVTLRVALQLPFAPLKFTVTG